MTKALSNLPGYRQESRVDEAISRLEQQLKRNNFKLSEEKRIVAEIDNLRRSRRFVRSVTPLPLPKLRHDVAMTMMTSTNVVLFLFSIANDLRAQITAMKESVRSMRVERDVSSLPMTSHLNAIYVNITWECVAASFQSLFKRNAQVRQEEDEIKKRAFRDKNRNEELKKEIDTLYEQKRTVTSHFKAQEKEYKDFLSQLRHKQKQQLVMKKQEERAKKEQEL